MLGVGDEDRISPMDTYSSFVGAKSVGRINLIPSRGNIRSK